jgi:hypothetical protein
MDNVVNHVRRLLEGSAQTVGYLGTRDERMQLSVSFVLSFAVKSDPFRVVAYLPEAALGQTERNLQINDYATLLVVNGGTFEGVQVKGNAVLKPGDEAGEAFFRMNIERLKDFYQVEEFHRPISKDPLMAVELTVKEIYDQTPGIGAGESLRVAEEGTGR